jgi:hypothetical protein
MDIVMSDRSSRAIVSEFSIEIFLCIEQNCPAMELSSVTLPRQAQNSDAAPFLAPSRLLMHLGGPRRVSIP